MEMKLIKLVIDNFKGIKHFEIDTQGKNIHIQSKNGKGKTTIYDAFLWVLFGKNSLGESKFTIRPTNAPNEIEPTVTAVFEIDGETKELKKVYASKFNKDTGEFKESVTECFINNVPKKIREYEIEISRIIDESIFKLLTNARHFNENLDWKERRKILFEVCGTMSDIDICNSDEDFTCLVDKLNKYGSIDEYKKSLIADKKNIAKEINEIPARIDEIYNQIGDSIDKAEMQVKLDELNNLHTKYLEEYNEIKNNSTSNITKKMQELEEKLYNLERTNQKHIKEQENKINAERNTKEQELNGMRMVIEQSQFKIERLNNQIAGLFADYMRLKQEYAQVNNSTWQGYTMCPTCNRELPTEQIEEAKAKFNLNKSNTLETIQAKGKELEAQIEQLKSELSEQTRLNGDTRKELQQLENSMQVSNEIPFNLPNYEEDKKAIEEQINTLNKKKVDMVANAQSQLLELSEKAKETAEKIKECNSLIAKAEMNNQLQDRISDLKAEQKRLKNKQSETLKMLDIIDKFIQAKVDSITENINAKFKIARFKLFEQNKTNDSITECCETICNNANRYNDINNAGKTIVGIDIIQTLAKHYGYNVPIFIDNVDSLDSDNINKLIANVEQQIITLKVSDDNELIIKR